MPTSTRERLLMGAAAAFTACAFSGVALAQTASAGAVTAAAPNGAPPPASTTSAGAEGNDVETVIVTAERQIGAKAAPVKASLDQTQPESIISHDFIESVTPEVGNISTVVFIAPSISGISGNAGGIGNYFSTTMRGFPDGYYNVTYDGIAFGDTNNPTHHPNDYFPVSEIGSAVVDRGPGAAGDLGQANYGGAIHYFSPAVSDTPTALQKFTYGSFNTFDSVTTLQSGDIRQLGGGKLWADFDERSSDTELSDSGGYALNQSIKFVLPADGGKFNLSAFVTHAWSRYNFPDGEGPGEDLPQIQAYGKNFQLDNIPGDEHYVGYNFERKQTWFTYVDAKYTLTPAITLEDQPYYYSYSNKTEAANATSDLIGVNTADNVKAPLTSKTDILGYLKRNDYQVFGDVFRTSYQLPFGVLKFGALVEGAVTYRQKAFYDFNTGQPDLEFTPAKDPALTAPTNYQLREFSNWHQEQGFIDFNWTPTSNLTISPGFKYVNFVREVNATNEKVNVDTTSASGVVTQGTTIEPLHGRNTYTSPLYFLTANYKLTSYFSAYAQYATSFVIPQLSELYTSGVELQDLKPETTINYQTGLVFSRGPVTWDADLYLINARNTNVPCNVPDPAGGYDAASCNAGTVHYSGFEGEGAYLLPFGLTMFVNGSINNARQLAQPANVTSGIAGNPAEPLALTPDYTGAAGLIYRGGPWQASVTFKQVGNEYVTGGASTAANHFTGEIKLPVYNTVNGDIAYTFMRRFQLKLQVFNLLDHRTVIGYVPQGNETTLFNPTSTTSFYTFQSGREIDGTISVKF